MELKTQKNKKGCYLSLSRFLKYLDNLITFISKKNKLYILN